MDSSDQIRYQCQIHLDEIGKQGQLKLASSSILCVGAGGLAHSALAYLAAAGIGKIGVVDGDRVEEGNLHRQILFSWNDVGQNKAQVITDKLTSQNSNIECIAYTEFLVEKNAVELIQQYDLILDCSDNYFTRYLVNDVCYRLTKPDVFAAVLGFTGYVTVFSRTHSPCYRCLYPTPPALANVQNCADFGVFGTVAGLFGLLQATEAVKILLGIGKPLYGELLRFNLLDASMSKRTIPLQATCTLCNGDGEIRNYPEYATFMALEITVEQAKQNWNDYQFLDVREAHEYKAYNLNMPTIPFSVLTDHFTDFDNYDKNKALLIVCAHGIRSKHAAELFKAAGYKKVYSLKGGLAEWQAQDETITHD